MERARGILTRVRILVLLRLGPNDARASLTPGSCWAVISRGCSASATWNRLSRRSPKEQLMSQCCQSFTGLITGPIVTNRLRKTRKYKLKSGRFCYRVSSPPRSVGSSMRSRSAQRRYQAIEVLGWEAVAITTREPRSSTRKKGCKSPQD
jgi:hypothetical protein